MPFVFLGPTGRSYVQYIDEATGRMLQAQPNRSYDMRPVPGAGNVPVPPGDGLWGAAEDAPEDKPAAPQPPAPPSAPPGAPAQPVRTNGNGKETTAADAAPEGSE